MQKFIDANGIDDVAALIQYANALTTKYGEAAAAASCDMYDAIAEAQGASVPPAVPARTPSMKETANVIQSALDRAPTTIPDETGKLVKKTATRTMRKNAVRDNAQMALVPSGDGCSFCKMLGSRGWEDARAAKSFEAHLHKNCRCEYVVRFGNDLNVEGYDPDALYDEFMQHEGSWDDKMNAMRRELYASNKDVINAQKREAYAKKPAVPKEKFTNYALNPDKAPDKAKAFQQTLGFNQDNYEALRNQIIQLVDVDKCKKKGDNDYGELYEQIMIIEGVNGKTANVCTGWIKKNGEERLTLTSLYVTKKKGDKR